LGYAKTWVAARGATREQTLAVLGLRGTGTFEELAESPFDGAALPSGWYLVEGECADERLLDAARLSALSEFGDVVTVSIEEHTMFSSISGWSGGRENWSVVHEANQSADHLEVTGTPPVAWTAIQERCRAEQETGDDEVDHIFEVPVELGRELTGYRHDADIDDARDEPFEVLEPITVATRPRTVARPVRAPRRAGPSFWKRLFGG
jgi:hypothetical protein